MSNTMSFLDQSFDVHLLVEDWRTKYYIESLFSLLHFKLQVIPIGNCDAVTSMVNLSWQRAANCPSRAIGWRDRDFSSDNKASWPDRNTVVFRSPAHEIENYILDWDALVKCSLAGVGDKTSDDIKDVAHSIATDSLFDVACCDVLAQLQKLYGDGFPKHPHRRRPKVHVATQEEAERFLLSESWFKTRETNSSKIFSNDYLMNMLEEAIQKYQGYLNSSQDSWRLHFPGKEIFEKLMHNLYHGSVDNEDMVKSVAQYQSSNRTIPEDLVVFIEELSNRLLKRWL